jgi:hypothetical protein
MYTVLFDKPSGKIQSVLCSPTDESMRQTFREQGFGVLLVDETQRDWNELTVLPLAKESAEWRVNQHFNNLASNSAFVDLEHAVKRGLAREAKRGKTPTELVEMARIEGVTTDELIATILSKPDDLAERMKTRRAMILAIRAATTVDEVEDAARLTSETA